MKLTQINYTKQGEILENSQEKDALNVLHASWQYGIYQQSRWTYEHTVEEHRAPHTVNTSNTRAERNRRQTNQNHKYTDSMCVFQSPTCPRSRVTFTSLYSVLRDRGGLCHHRSVPSMALVMGCARSLSPWLQMSQYWPWKDREVNVLIFSWADWNSAESTIKC